MNISSFSQCCLNNSEVHLMARSSSRSYRDWRRAIVPTLHTHERKNQAYCYFNHSRNRQECQHLTRITKRSSHESDPSLILINSQKRSPSYPTSLNLKLHPRTKNYYSKTNPESDTHPHVSSPPQFPSLQTPPHADRLKTSYQTQIPA